MVSTSHHEFGAQTTATEVAVAFSEQVRSRTILITGVNKLGIGYATAAAFASQNADTIIIAGRSSNKLEESLESLSFEFPDVKFRQLLVDLSSQSSVRRAATEVLSWTDVRVIDLVINNAGIMLIPGRTLSQDGIELHFATNHVGHFLLTNLLAPKIIAAARSAERGATRIINVTSLACIVSGIRFSDHNWTSSSSTLPENERPNPALLKMSGLAADETMSYIAMGAYAASKSANSLFSVELNKRIFPKHGIVSVALHPGEIESELQRHADRDWIRKAHKAMKIESKTTQQGASTTLVGALDPLLANFPAEVSSLFLNDCQVWTKLPVHAMDPGDAERLWQLTETIVQEKFRW